ncbi:hypothetical protein AB0958_44200 [Streptomyces sp. NPDC006655]|uniref:hypothetical protein n=1 Tax=Streptomyces sp. NPDC006655 TaxID=3156898 RepID=UPI0034526EB6
MIISHSSPTWEAGRTPRKLMKISGSGPAVGDRLCARVKGLAEPSEQQQRQALKAASRSRSATVLAALITTGSGTPHPHSRRLAGVGDGPMAQAAWQQAVADVHASFRPSSPPRGARPGGHAT